MMNKSSLQFFSSDAVPSNQARLNKTANAKDLKHMSNDDPIRILNKLKTRLLLYISITTLRCSLATE